MDALMLDGNAAAGLLQEVFADEMTTAVGTCDNCGASEAVGAVHLYRGAGIVLRCPQQPGAVASPARDRVDPENPDVQPAAPERAEQPA